MRKLLIGCIALCLAQIAVASEWRDTTYMETPISITTATGEIFGTLTLPDRPGGPVVLIIAGSGPTDRNGNSIFTKNNSLQMLARELANLGIPSVRYDKRGVMQSAKALKSELAIRFEDYIDDAVAWIELLKKDKRFTAITVLGHSEGSLIGMVAAAKAGADKYISVSGTARPIDEILLQQLKNSPELYDLAAPVIDSLRQGRTTKTVDMKIFNMLRPGVQPYMISWMKYNPQNEIKKLTIPVMLVQGTTDLQVPVEEVKSLAAAKPGATLLVIENMNHVLKYVDGDREANAATYKDPVLPLAKGLVDGIAAFIKKAAGN